MINYLWVNFCCSLVLSLFLRVETFCVSKFCVRSFLLLFILFLTFLVQSSLVLHFYIVAEWTFVSLCHFFACRSFVVLKLFKHFCLIFLFSLRIFPFFFAEEKAIVFSICIYNEVRFVLKCSICHSFVPFFWHAKVTFNVLNFLIFHLLYIILFEN